MSPKIRNSFFLSAGVLRQRHLELWTSKLETLFTVTDEAIFRIFILLLGLIPEFLLRYRRSDVPTLNKLPRFFPVCLSILVPVGLNWIRLSSRGHPPSPQPNRRFSQPGPFIRCLVLFGKWLNRSKCLTDAALEVT